MKIDYTDFNEKSSFEGFILDCEDRFDKEINSAVDFVISSSCKAITLAGPTCSGKTTGASRLCAAFEHYGKRARLVSIDDFYRSDSEMKRLGITDFEGISAVDRELFHTVCLDLVNRRKTYIPTFDFTLRSRSDMLPYMPSDNDIYIFEGIQAIYPEVLECISGFTYKSIFINVFDGICIGEACFSPVEIRLIRRIVRDFYNRAASVSHTLSLWENVRKNEEANIFPNIKGSDVCINSVLPYEILILGKKFLLLTEDFVSDSPFCKDVSDIREKLIPLKDLMYDAEMIPESSLLREFAF